MTFFVPEGTGLEHWSQVKRCLHLAHRLCVPGPVDRSLCNYETTLKVTIKFMEFLVYEL